MTYAYLTRDDLKAKADGVVRKDGLAEGIEQVGDRTLRFVVSTGSVDRDNDTINPKGWQLDNYKQNPVVLWAHDYSQLPVARTLDIGEKDGKLTATAEFAKHEFAETVFDLLKGGFLRSTSVGFRPMKVEENTERKGYDFHEQELLEFSIVPVPSNPEALIQARSAGVNVAPILKWAAAVTDAVKAAGLVMSKGQLLQVLPEAKAAAFTLAAPVEGLEVEVDILEAESDPIRWNRSLSKAFDMDDEPVEPSRKLYQWVSRFLATPVKDLYETGMTVGGAKLGALMVALEEQLGAFKVDSVRNIAHGTEAPPTYETIQLNSTKSQDFLIDGTRFLRGTESGMKLVVRTQPTWAGLHLSFFAPQGAKDEVIALIARAWRRASQLQLLKGEAFCLSGEFLTREPATFDDVFLAPATREPLMRTVKLVNEHGAAMDPRGIILMGPPGTGKTLVARTIMSECKDATFIWLSSRDFDRMGMFGGLKSAFDLGRENAPTVLFMDDIDSYWSSDTVDLLKQELDGLKQLKGIVTILATNHPETLPEALIDRPGRFHDVLMLDLPTETIRREMLARWAPDAPTVVLDQLAKDTLQFSGAHLRDLVRYAETLRAQDGLEVGEALQRALAKLKEQRDTIAGARKPRYRSVTSAPVPWPVEALAESTVVKTDALKIGGVDIEELAAALAKYLKPTITLDGTVLAETITRNDKVMALQAVPEMVLELEDDCVLELTEDAAYTADLTPEELRAALRGAVVAALATTVEAETTAALNRARGRVD